MSSDTKVKVTLVKKIDFFSTEKMAINGVNWHFSVLLQSRTHFSLGIDALSAEKLALHSIALKKWRKLALFSATAVAGPFFH